MSTGMSSKRSFANISDSPVVDSCNRAPFVASPIKRHKPDIPLMPPQSQQQNTIQSHFPDAKVFVHQFMNKPHINWSVPERKSRFKINLPDAKVCANQFMNPIVEARSLKRKRANKTPKTTWSDEQVRILIEDALRIQAAHLVQEFDSRTNQLLEEQFKQFTQFNHDYVSRMFQGDMEDCSYIS